MNVSDIIKIDTLAFKKLTAKEQKELATSLMSAANKRLKRLEKSGVGKLAPSYQSATKDREKFSVKGKTGKALAEEFNAMKRFYEMKTSNVRSARKWVKTNIGNLSEETASDLWREFKKIQEEDPSALSGGKDYNRLLDYVRDIIKKGDEDKAKDGIKKMRSVFQSYYEKRKTEEEDLLNGYFFSPLNDEESNFIPFK